MSHLRTSILLCLALVPFAALPARADGVSAIKACEADNEGPEDTARLTILPNGETRGSDTAAALIRMARQKAKESKDAEAIQWAALCNFSEQSEQEAIKRDRASVPGTSPLGVAPLSVGVDVPVFRVPPCDPDPVVSDWLSGRAVGEPFSPANGTLGATASGEAL